MATEAKIAKNCMCLFLRVLGCCLLLTTVALSQQAADQASGGNPPAVTIKSNARNVLLDVVVTDRAGKAIHGLTKDDFTVIEDGKPQQLRGFDEQVPEEKPQGRPQTVNLPPDTYTNYLSSGESGAVNIVLFDSLNTDRQGLATARQQLVQYLAKLPGNARVALYTLDGRLHLVHGFTDDPQELMEAARQLSSDPHPLGRKARDVSADITTAVQLGVKPQMYRSLVNLLSSEYEGKAEARTELTMEALNELARSMAVFPGRKNLIWISGGIPFDPTTTTPQMQKTAALLAATQIAVYPIDVRGVVFLGADAAASGNEVYAPRGGDYSDSSGQADELSRVRETMMQMAALTGGKAHYNRNDLASQVDEIVDAGSSYYTLAYRPQNGNWDGKFRKIRVKTSQPNLKVQCRPGYYAVADPFRSPDIDRTFSLAMQPDVPASTALIIKARVLPPDAPDKPTLIDFLVDVHDLAYLQSADHRLQPDVMFVAAAWDMENKPQGSVSGTYRQTLASAGLQSLMRTGLRLQQELPLKPGTYQLRVGVVDRISGKIATIDVPLTVESKVAHE